MSKTNFVPSQNALRMSPLATRIEDPTILDCVLNFWCTLKLNLRIKLDSYLLEET